MGSSPTSAPPAPPERRGSETPRIWTKPLRKLTPKTSAGFACIEFAELVLGIDLLPWQRWLLIHALELLPDGTYRFRTVVVLVARQNGKSTLMTVLALWRMYVDGAPLVIGTAQNLDVAEEQWEAAVDMAQGVPELDAEIAQVSKVNGKKFLRLTGRQRYKVAAASRRGGRGLSGDLILLDELREHQNWHAWGAVTKTTMARALAQVWAASNAGDASSIVLAFLRALAHAALGNPDDLPTDLEAPSEDEDVDDIDSLGLFEWSATPGCDKADRDEWARANPALGYTITERAIASACRTDPDDVFRTEVLCQWVDIPVADQVIPLDAWSRCEDPMAKGNEATYSLDCSPDLLSAAIGASDGLVGKVLEHGPGTHWVVRKLQEHGIETVLVDPRSPAGALIPEIENAGITVITVSPQQHAQWCGGLLAAVRFEPGPGEALKFLHTGQPVLDAAVRGASRRPYGDAWAWNRRTASVDICSLVAVTNARGGAVDGAGADYDILESVL